MTPAEAAVLLGIAASFDNRKPDETAATAWATALDGLRFEDCRDAIVAHYRISREWIMPADVITVVKKVRGGRIEDAPPIPIPAGFDPDDTAAYQRLLAESRRAQAEGRMAPLAEYHATRSLGELKSVLRSVPAIAAKPSEKTAEHQVAIDRARTELANRREVPMPDADEPENETASPPPGTRPTLSARQCGEANDE